MKTHRPGYWLALAFMVGILVDSSYHPPFLFESIMLGASVIAAAACFRWRAGIIFIIIAMAALGALSAKKAATLPRDHVLFVQKWFRGSEVAVKGVVASDVDVRQVGRRVRVALALDVAEVCREARCNRVAGRVLVNMFVPPPLVYGDEVVLRGKLHRPFEYSQRGHASYRDYLRRRGILLALTVKKTNGPVVTGHGKGNALVAQSLRCRAALSRVYQRYLPPAEAGLMIAFMLGDRSGIPPHVRELVVRTGTAHSFPTQCTKTPAIAL